MFSVICDFVGDSKRFGIKGETLSVADITSVERVIHNLLDLLNQHEASEIHVYDIIEDWLGQD